MKKTTKIEIDCGKFICGECKFCIYDDDLAKWFCVYAYFSEAELEVAIKKPFRSTQCQETFK